MIFLGGFKIKITDHFIIIRKGGPVREVSMFTQALGGAAPKGIRKQEKILYEIKKR